MRYVGPSHPRMVGRIAVVAFLWAFVVFLMPESERSDFIPQTIVPIGALVGVGALGAIDDFVNVKYGFGIRGGDQTDGVT